MFSNFNNDATYLAPCMALVTLPVYIYQDQCVHASFIAFAAAAEAPNLISLTYPHVPALRPGPGHAAPDQAHFHQPQPVRVRIGEYDDRIEE
eukprot:g25969.t1